MSVKVKFQCISITDFGESKEAKFNAVYSTTGENADFAKSTPYGDLKIRIDLDTPAHGYFQPGKEYYLEFEEVPS